jgi:hypothetical protein
MAQAVRATAQYYTDSWRDDGVVDSQDAVGSAPGAKPWYKQ